jgi:hypothetical protein
MERRQYYRNEWVSIYSLMRDGSELAEGLRRVRAYAGPTASEHCATSSIPYVQLVDDARREQTGFLLKEIWRYFATRGLQPIKAFPAEMCGSSFEIVRRSITLSSEFAALGSAIVQLTVRDQWIGWNRDAFLRWAKENQSELLANWVWSSLNGLMAGIYTADLIEKQIISQHQIDEPNDATIAKLREFAQKAKNTTSFTPRLLSTRQRRFHPKHGN